MTLNEDGRAALARELMAGFAERTGLTSPAPPKRYLWTDAFAVCNFLGLGEIGLALRLVDQVHHTLGRHRPDDRYLSPVDGNPGAEGILEALESMQAEPRNRGEQEIIR